MESNNQPDDQSLRDALQGVSAPAGLHQRLLSRLRQEAAVYELPRLGDSRDDGVASPRQAASSGRRRLGRRHWVGLALALSFVGLAFGAFQWSRPASTELLAQFTLGQLDRLLGDDAVWQADIENQLAELEVLRGQLRFNVKPLGFQDIAGGALSEQCRVWKLYSLTTKKSFYVFDFQHARQIPSLNGQLQAIRRTSGGWSLVALRIGDRLVLVLVEGALDSYLYQSQSA